MKLPKILNNKKNIIAFIVLAFIVMATVGGGLYLSNKKKKQTENTTPQTEEEKQIQQNVENKEKSANDQNSTNQATQNNTSTQTSTNLDDVTIQGALLVDQNNAIATSLYGAAGTYTVEKKVGSSWQTVVSKVQYSGRGGLDLNDQILVSETERTYRVYRIVDGSTVGPKEILIDRNLVVSRGGVTNFPGAL